MERSDQLLKAYRSQVAMPWRTGLAGPERVWMAVYPPDLERRVRARTEDFKVATNEAGHPWVLLDLTTAFPTWMAAHPHREAYFAAPELITPALTQFMTTVEASVRQALTSDDADDSTVVALLGVAALFPMIRVSDLLQRVSSSVRGRLLLFFPGSYEAGNYRLLDARDGWNYLAIPITITEGGSR